MLPAEAPHSNLKGKSVKRCGRGSPARVGALLDQWWEQLAVRLRGETRLPGLPTEVAQAFVAIWRQATILAQGVADQALAAQRQVLAEEREALVALEARARLDVAQARQSTTEAVVARQSAETRLADLEQLLIQRQTQIDDLRVQRDELLTQRDDARHQVVEVQQQLHESRGHAEQARIEQQRYTRDVEDRAYREIDRTREESKIVVGQFRDLSQRQQLLQQALLPKVKIAITAPAKNATPALMAAAVSTTCQVLTCLRMSSINA